MVNNYLSLTEAREIANEVLQRPPQDPEFSYVIFDDAIIEKPTCFVFNYQSSKYLRSGRFEDQLVGNSPILVDRRTGEVHFLGTALTIEHYIRDFEAGRLPSQVHKKSGDGT